MTHEHDGGGAGGDAAGGSRDPYAPFRPRATRIVSFAIIVLLVVGLVAFVVVTSTLESPQLINQITAGVVVALVCLLLFRFATTRAVPGADGLMVRNVILRHHLEWAQIVNVRFGERDWVLLDLSDGDVLAVMAIQRVDGEQARAESRRLAGLVAAHEGTGSGD